MDRPFRLSVVHIKIQPVYDSFAHNPPLMLLLGMTAVLAVVVPVLIWQGRRFGRLRDEYARLDIEKEQLREILVAAPDGLFVWDHTAAAGDTEKCSRRLAVLLGLDAGVHSRFSHVLSCFDEEPAKKLKAAVQDLHQNGTSFDLLLDRDDRHFQVTGTRATTPDGRVVNDLMWVHDIMTTIPATSGPLTGEAAFEHFTFMLNSLPLSLWIRDGQSNVIFANPAAHLLGITEGQPLPTLEAMVQTEIPARGWSGSIGFAVQCATAPDDAEGLLPEGLVEQSVLDHLGTAIAIFDAKTKLTFSNAAFADLWGLKPDWLDTAPTLGEILDHLRVQRRLPEVTDFRVFRDQQLALFTRLTGSESSLLHLPDGRTLQRFVAPYSAGGLFFSFEDDTGRLDLERSFNALGAVQRETLDNLYEGIAVFGSDGRLKLSNPVFSGIWNLPDDLLDKNPHVSDFVNATRPLIAGPEATSDEAWARHVDKLIARLSARQADTGRIELNNGMILDFCNVALPDGAMLLSYLDVSDSARVEAALRQRAEALDQANRLKSEFIANVSHEVTIPLATLIGYADILAQENYGELNTRQKEYSQGILDNAQSLMDVINDILDLATIEAGMMTLQLDTVELHTMLASLVNLIRERARRKNLKIKFDCPPDIGWIVADEKRLKQVLFNLLSNAINFTPSRGTITLNAERSGEADNEAIIFKVSDTGRGIPKARQLDIFEAFGKAKNAHQDEEEDAGRTGAGLGLSLVKRFVELHGGAVDIKSPPGRGTTVTCTLPASGRKQSSQANIKVVDQQDIA